MFIFCCIYHIQEQPYKKRTAWRKSTIAVTILDDSEGGQRMLEGTDTLPGTNIHHTESRWRNPQKED